MARPDDESISADTNLLRALRCKGWSMPENERVRATSLAFYDGYTGETSCHLDSHSGRALFVRRFPQCSAARFTAGQARDCGFQVTRDPEGDPENSADHVVLTLAERGARRKVYQKACKELAVQCEVVAYEVLAGETG
jgi:hypothetical protein